MIFSIAFPLDIAKYRSGDFQSPLWQSEIAATIDGVPPSMWRSEIAATERINESTPKSHFV